MLIGGAMASRFALRFIIAFKKMCSAPGVRTHFKGRSHSERQEGSKKGKRGKAESFLAFESVAQQENVPRRAQIAID
jgi:hypothetical protein